MRRITAAFAAAIALVLGLILGLTASAATPNDTACRKVAATNNPSAGVNSPEVLDYTACRDDKIDADNAAILAALKAGQSPTPSPSATPRPSVTPTRTATPSPTPTSASPTPSSTPTVPAGATCTNPSKTFTGEGSSGVSGPDPGGYGGNGYDISQEQWGVKAGYAATLKFCSKDSWNVAITAKDDDGQHAVQSYPSIRRIYHDWSTSNFSNDPRLSRFPRLTVGLSIASPSCSGCIYETAFDNWLNGIGSGASTEQMIWLRNQGQRPYGNQVGTATIDGRSWEVWSGNGNHYVAFVPAGGAAIDAATIDVRAFIQYQVDHGLIGANASVANAQTDPTVGQVSLGIEPVKVDGQRWDFKSFDLQDSGAVSPNRRQATVQHPAAPLNRHANRR